MTTYFVKLLSSVPPEKVSVTTQKIVQSLAVNPLKVESLLSKSEGGIVRADSLAKAVKIAYVFRKAGVLVEVVSQEQSIPSITLTSVPTTVQESLPLPTSNSSSNLFATTPQRPLWRRIPGFRSSTLSGNILASLSYIFLITTLLISFISPLNESNVPKENVPEKILANTNSDILLQTVTASISEPQLPKLSQLHDLSNTNITDVNATGISSENAIHELEGFFELESSPLKDGTPRLLGTGNNGMSFLELIGDQNSLNTATIFIEASLDDKKLNTQNFLLMSLFTKNLAPDWEESQQWLISSIPELLTTPENKVSKIVGNKVVDLTAIPQTAIVSLSFSFFD